MVNEINVGEFNEKAASYPLKGGGFYRGTVLSKVDGKVQIYVADLNCTFKDVEFIGQTTLYSLAVNDQIICGFLGNQTNSIFVLGAISKKTDIFASAAIVTTLGVDLAALEARVDALEGP